MSFFFFLVNTWMLYGQKMEKFAAIKMVQTDNSIDLPIKPQTYYQRRWLMSLYSRKEITQDVYFQAMMRLTDKKTAPFPFNPADEV